MATFSITVNGVQHNVEAEPDMPLLWVLRDILNLTGTKFGCGVASCGACTVLADGHAVKSCVLPIQSVENQKITTIEGLSADGNHPIQVAWETIAVPQCGYCQSGQMLTLAGLLNQKPSPTEDELEAAMSQVLCRCGTYQRIRQAALLATKKSKL
ncbi:MAG: (2Fe-2S)-binding protein [Saprospiraceae bacterium]|nr:(2Fe-2S)-binding protein [Saprospiraceae bacterium]